GERTLGRLGITGGGPCERLDSFRARREAGRDDAFLTVKRDRERRRPDLPRVVEALEVESPEAADAGGEGRSRVLARGPDDDGGLDAVEGVDVLERPLARRAARNDEEDDRRPGHPVDILATSERWAGPPARDRLLQGHGRGDGRRDREGDEER